MGGVWPSNLKVLLVYLSNLNSTATEQDSWIHMQVPCLNDDSHILIQPSSSFQTQAWKSLGGTTHCCWVPQCSFPIWWLTKSQSGPPTADHTTSQLRDTGFFGEGAHDERDDLQVSGNWPTLDNSSRLKRHTWSTPQPSAGAMGVWCIDPPPEQPMHRPGLDSVQVAATYAVISEPVPNYASANVFTAWDKAPFDSQWQSRAVWRQRFEGKSRVKDGNLLIGETLGDLTKDGGQSQSCTHKHLWFGMLEFSHVDCRPFVFGCMCC